MLVTLDREGDGDLPSLLRPLDADHPRMHPKSLGDLHDHRVLDVHGVVLGAVAVRAIGGADGAIADGHDAAIESEAE